jgi:DNA-binding NarL/FixJ family response regulator
LAMTTLCTNRDEVVSEAWAGTARVVSTPMPGTDLCVAPPGEGRAVPLRILLADDHQILRQHVRALLEQEGFEVVGEASDGCEAVLLARRFRPDMVILDVSMPALNGLAAAGEILRDAPRTRAILLTLRTEPPYVLKAIRAGVRGYVGKDQAADELVQAIGQVSRGEVYLGSSISRSVVEACLPKADLQPHPAFPGNSRPDPST